MSAVALILGAPLDKSPGRPGASVRGAGGRAGRTSGVAQGERLLGASARDRGEQGFPGPLGVGCAPGRPLAALWAWAAAARGSPAAQVSAPTLLPQRVGLRPLCCGRGTPGAEKPRSVPAAPPRRPGGGGSGAGLAAVNGAAEAAGRAAPHGAGPGAPPAAAAG